MLKTTVTIPVKSVVFTLAKIHQALFTVASELSFKLGESQPSYIVVYMLFFCGIDSTWDAPT